MLYRKMDSSIEVLLVHPGGPFWKKKDLGVWSIPKGLPNEGEDVLAAAKREFREETGIACPDGEPLELGEVRQKSGKRVQAWAIEGDIPTANCSSNGFTTEWPPKSGKMREFPEIDRWCYFAPEEAKHKLIKEQWPLLDRLMEQLRSHS